MPNIVINDTINLSFFETAIGISVISDHNSFRVLFDKIPFVYILFEKYIYILTLKMASSGNPHCAICIGTLSFPIKTLRALIGNSLLEGPLQQTTRKVPTCKNDNKHTECVIQPIIMLDKRK